MTRFTYHCSQEQFSPAALLTLARRAEAAGFDGAFSSDHCHPWAEAQGQSGFTWSWLGAAMAATEHLSFGCISVPGGWRYHPAILAQAVGTLGQMFPGRLPWIALGSGQLLNEGVVGGAWPDKGERTARLREGAAVMRALLAGETVTRRGRLEVVGARVWSRPEVPTLLMGAATTAATAAGLADWADGMLTVSPDHDALRRVVDAFRDGGGEGRPMHLKVDLSWAPTEAEALAQAHAQWRFNALGGDSNWDIRRPADFEAATRFVRPDDLRRAVLVSSDPEQLADTLRTRMSLGFESLNLHNVGTNQAAFLDMAGERLLPLLRA